MNTFRALCCVLSLSSTLGCGHTPANQGTQEPAPLHVSIGPAEDAGPSATTPVTVDSADKNAMNTLQAPPDVGQAPTSATRMLSGLAYRVLTPGRDEAKPTDTSKVVVNYTGWTTDGKMFDSSVKRGKPATFPVSGVIKGWTEMLQLMTPGEHVRVWIPGSLAYGDNPVRPGAPAGTLVFDIELLEIQ